MLTNRSHRRRSLPGERPFHLLLLALAVSTVGDWLYNVALLAFVYARTGSPTWVAVTTAGRVLPLLVLGPLAGALADRHNRRTLMIGSDLVRAGLMAALATVVLAGLPVVLAPLLAALAASIGTVQMPSVAACSARLVSTEELPRAGALRAAIGQGAVVVGPALGAVVLALSDPAVAIALNALTFLGSAAAVSAIGRGPAFEPASAHGERPAGVLEDVREGARALRGAPAALRLVGADVVCSGVAGMLTVTLVLVSRRLGAGTGGYGLLLGACGLGGVMGAVLSGRVASPAQWRRALALALALVALALVGLGAVSALGGALVVALLVGGGMVVREALSEGALPALLDHDVLARAYGLIIPASVLASVGGSLLAGPLVGLLGVSGTLSAGGAFVALAGVALLVRPLQGRPVAAPALG